MCPKSLLANETLWGIVNALYRAATSLSVKRVFDRFRSSKIFAYLLLFASALHGLAILLEALLICRPISAGWSQNPTGSCGHQVVSFLVLEIIGLVIDVGLLVLPVYCIRLLQLSSRRKLRIYGVFSAGFV